MMTRKKDRAMGNQVEFEQMKAEPDSRFTLAVYCAEEECGAELNRTLVMTGSEMFKKWTHLVLSQPLVTKPCPNGCRSTWNDCNINVNTVIECAGEEKRGGD